LAVLALVYQGFTYTKTEKDAQLGPIQIQQSGTHSVLSAHCWRVCIVGGVLALAAVVEANGKSHRFISPWVSLF